MGRGSEPKTQDLIWITGIALMVGAVYFVVVQRVAIANLLAPKPQPNRSA